MTRTTPILIASLLSILLCSCKPENPNYQADAANAQALHTAMQGLTDVIVHDIFSPPQASRVYAYPSIAAYEAIQWQDSSLISLAGQLNGLTKIPTPGEGVTYCYPVAAITAFNKVAKSLIFSEQKIAAVDSLLQQELRDMGIPSKVYKNSVQYGEEIADHILTWASKDNYNQSRSFAKYSVTDQEDRWKPTPPGYMEGIEPHWREIRPFVLDSAQQFTPPLPTEYSMNPSSTFYKELMEVYDVRKNLTSEQKEIASFWDCNPYVLNVTGHVMHASKKITPGGHWMGITAIAAKKANSSMAESARAYALTSIALADAFISCWDEKYRSNLIRPETVINEKIDPDWLPLLQTPPFPEYTSGHSVISSAAAIALTSLYGDNFAFDDDVEVPYGLPMRSFTSFIAASEEAAISRLYGGIHYRPAIDNGVVQGRALGRHLVSTITFTSKQ